MVIKSFIENTCSGFKFSILYAAEDWILSVFRLCPCYSLRPKRLQALYIYSRMPPVSSITWPVMNDDSSEARNSARFATSAGWPTRPIG